MRKRVQQQHNGVVVVEERGNPAELCPAPRERRRTWERGRAAPELGVPLPSHPSTIYRWGERGAGPPRSHLGLGRRPRGGAVPPKASGAPAAHPRVSNPRRRGKAHGGRPSPLRAGSVGNMP